MSVLQKQLPKSVRVKLVRLAKTSLSAGVNRTIVLADLKKSDARVTGKEAIAIAKDARASIK